MKNKALQAIVLCLCVALYGALFTAFFGMPGARAQAPLISSIQGPDLFKAYCASCHGLDAKGKGTLAKNMKTPPSDLTRIALRNHGTFPLVRVQKVISGEEAVLNGHGSAQMPVWGPVFSQIGNDTDLGKVRIDNLARYLRDIQVMK